MDNTTWAFGPDGPQWPVDGSGQKEKAVRLMNSFDSAADSDMTISLLAAYGIPCFKYYDLDGGAGKGHQRLFRLRRGAVCPGVAPRGGQGDSAGGARYRRQRIMSERSKCI